MSRLRSIGWSFWNPIGFQGPPETPADEYDEYLLEALRRIELGEPMTVVATYLLGIERDRMTLNQSPSAHDRALMTVKAISCELHKHLTHS